MKPGPAAVIATFIGSSSTSHPHPTIVTLPNPDQAATQDVNLINALRNSKRLAALAVDPQLMEQAVIRAAQNATTLTPSPTPNLNDVNAALNGRYYRLGENELMEECNSPRTWDS